MTSRAKTGASDAIVKRFCDWLQTQEHSAQWDVMTYAEEKYGLPQDHNYLQDICDYLRDEASGPEVTGRISAKFGLLHLSPALDFSDGVDAVKRYGMQNFDLELPMKNGRICDRITAAQAAELLCMSRATFFREAKCQRFRESLGYAATNSRNGRYSLELVLDAALQKLPVFCPRSLKA